jgi:hypothetical protein
MRGKLDLRLPRALGDTVENYPILENHTKSYVNHPENVENWRSVGLSGYTVCTRVSHGWRRRDPTALSGRRHHGVGARLLAASATDFYIPGLWVATQ